MIAFDNYDIVWSEAIDQLGRLSGYHDLNPRRQRTNQAANDVYRVWVEPELRLVNDQDVRQVLLRLQQKRNEGHNTQHSVRGLGHAEYLITVPFTPLQE